MKKQPYVVLNLDDSTYWWVDDAKSPKDAIDDYCFNCQMGIEKEEVLSLQAVPVKQSACPIKYYKVTVVPAIKVTMERA